MAPKLVYFELEKELLNLRDKISLKLIYFVLEKELLNFSETALRSLDSRYYDTDAIRRNIEISKLTYIRYKLCMFVSRLDILDYQRATYTYSI